MADYIERLAVSSDETTSIYKIVADGQSFTRTCVDRRYYMITDTALASGCLIDISTNNPKDEINIYVQVNSTWYRFLSNSCACNFDRVAYATNIHFNCGNGGRIYMVGNTDLTDCEINSTKGITVSNILFGISYGTITVRRTCLDSTLVLYNSFEDVLKTVDVSSVIGNVSSVAYYNNDATNGYIIHSFVDKNTFDTTLENYLNYDSVDAAYDSVSANASSLTSGTTFLGKTSSSSTCEQITADQIKTYVKSGDTATLTLQRCGSTIKKYDALPGTGSATVNIPIQQCGSVFGNEYTTVYSLASYSMTNTSYYTRWLLGTLTGAFTDSSNTTNRDCILINGCFGNWTTGRVQVSALLSTRGSYKLTGTYSVSGRYKLSDIALTIFGSSTKYLYLYLKGDYQYAHFTITAGANSFSPQTTVSSTILSAVYGTDVFAQLYPSSFNVNIGAVSSTSVTQIYEYQPDAMNGCMIYYYAYESSQQGELQMIVKNSNGAAALAIMSGETSYWGAQTLCLTGYIPPGGSAVLYGKQLASSFMWALPC